MVDSALIEKVRNVLITSYFNDAGDFVDVSEGPADDIHIVIVSRKFDAQPASRRLKQDLIWSVLVQKLPPEDWGRVSLTVGTSPEEVKAF